MESPKREQPRREIPLEIFQQLRDNPQFSVEDWLARRIFKHFKLGVPVRQRIRYELLLDRPKGEQTYWEAALLVLREYIHARRGGSVPPYRAFRETPKTSAAGWYADVILRSANTPPHMLVRTHDDRAVVMWSTFSHESLGSVQGTYSVRGLPYAGLVLVVQALTVYLGPWSKQDRELLLAALFSGSRGGVPDCPMADEEEEDADYE